MSKRIESVAGPYREQTVSVERLQADLALLVQRTQAKYRNRQLLAALLCASQISVYIKNTQPDKAVSIALLSFISLMLLGYVRLIRKQVHDIGGILDMQEQIVPVRNTQAGHVRVQKRVEESWESMAYSRLSIQFQAAMTAFLTIIVSAKVLVDSTAKSEMAVLQLGAGVVAVVLDALVGCSLDQLQAEYRTRAMAIGAFVDDERQKVSVGVRLEGDGGDQENTADPDEAKEKKLIGLKKE